MAQLSPAELRKYDWRAGVFVEKLKKGTPFELSGGKMEVLSPIGTMKEAVRILEKGSNGELAGLKFTGQSKGGVYALKDIVKNKEFGGKGEGSGTIKEDRALGSLKNQLEAAKKKEKSATIPVRMGGKTYQVYDVKSTHGTPKSDFHFEDVDGKEILWMSHKDGKTERDFQQWSGTSSSKEQEIFSHRETQQFIKDMKALYPKGMPNATTVARKIKDPRLKSLAIYGNQLGKQFGQQNVNICLQGDVILKKEGKFYTVTAYHSHLNGEQMRGGYEPAFMLVYKGDRSDHDIRGGRLTISPIGCRKVTFMG